MSDKKLRLPASYGGIISYNEEYSSKIRISPMGVIIISIIFVAIIFILHAMS